MTESDSKRTSQNAAQVTIADTLPFTTAPTLIEERRSLG
jgi:hypothetical protein